MNSDFQFKNNNIVNNNLVETDIKLLGDHKIIEQIVRLLAYIRHAVKYNLTTTI